MIEVETKVRMVHRKNHNGLDSTNQPQSEQSKDEQKEKTDKVIEGHIAHFLAMQEILIQKK